MPRRTRPKRRQRTYTPGVPSQREPRTRDEFETLARSLVLRGLASPAILTSTGGNARFLGALFANTHRPAAAPAAASTERETR